jgi:hypothetical protein
MCQEVLALEVLAEIVMEAMAEAVVLESLLSLH